MVVVSRFNLAEAIPSAVKNVSTGTLSGRKFAKVSGTERESASFCAIVLFRKRDNGASAIIKMMVKSMRIRADFLFTGAKVQIKYYFRERLTQIITELMNLFKHINPMKEAFETSLTKRFKTTCRLFHRPFHVQMCLRIKLVSITHHLFFKGIRFILTVKR